jgi:heme exporter protein C
VLTLVIILVSTWLAFTIGEVAGGETETAITVEKNIVYIHVPSAICTTLCFVALLVASIGYLATGKPNWDHLAAASAEVALVFATVLNVTGSIFAYPFWNTWWTPSPRLISSAILWFLCIAYLILRANIQNQRHRARICAVFGIIAFLDVPMVFITARMMPDMHIPNIEFGSPAQGASFGLSILGIMLLGCIMIWLKTDILKSKAKLESDLT